MARLLVADDDLAIRSTLVRGLEAHGYDVDTASNGLEALEALADGDYDLVLTDINMPSMDGIELLLKLVEQRPGLKVIAISGGGLFPKHELLEDARILGAVDVLEKPFDIGSLVARVQDALATS